MEDLGQTVTGVRRGNGDGVARSLGGGDERRLDREETRDQVLANGRMEQVGQVGRHCMDNKPYGFL